MGDIARMDHKRRLGGERTDLGDGFLEGAERVRVHGLHVEADVTGVQTCALRSDALATLKEAIAKVGALPAKPAFMIHTGDITHLSKPDQFDDAAQVIGSAGLDVHYVPGEHDLLDETPGKSYLERYGKNAKGAGWYSFDHNGVHFIALVNVVNLQAGSMGVLGAEQLA